MTIHRFTVSRYLTSDQDRRPDSLLFAKDEPFTEEEVKAIITDPAFRSLFGKLPVGIKAYPTGSDYRAVLTSNSYHTSNLSDGYIDVFGFYEDPEKNNELVRFNYREALDGCFQVFRAMGCTECPHKGRTCLNLNIMKLDLEEAEKTETFPWIFLRSFRTSNEHTKGLCDPITGANHMYSRTEKFEMDVPDTEKLFNDFAAKVTVSGWTWVDPSKTKTEESARANRPLRRPQEHVFKDIIKAQSNK